MKPGKKDLYFALSFFSIVSLIVYITVRAVLLFFSHYTGLEKFIAILLICGEAFIIIHALGYVLNIIKVVTERGKIKVGIGTLPEEPSVAIVVAARHEPKEVLEETFITLNNLKYKNKTIYFLDDSSEEKFKKEAQDLCSEYGLTLFRRKERHGAKAGIINDCLKGLSQEYLAVFDADQNPLPDFLNAVIPLLEEDKKLAFVQTPQFYTNIGSSRVARGAGFQQAVFYEYICEGKSTDSSMFCCGTNVVFRAAALKEVGGFDESTVTEDFATSIKLHSLGWKSLYYNHVYAFGSGPESLTGYFKQQFRWAAGTISVLKKVLWQLISRPFSLKPGQWWEYFLSSSYYLIGFIAFCLMAWPIIYLLFRVPSFFARKEVYITVFLPYIFLSWGVFYTVLKDRNYTIKDLLLGQLLGFSTFSVYMRAAFTALLGVKTTFGITEKTRGKSIAYIKLWPQISMMLLNFIAVIWGLNRFVYEREPAILINGAWAMYHFVLLAGIFYFNEEPA